MKNESHILLTINSSYLEITLNRPEKKNALTESMYECLSDALNMASTNDEIRLVYLRSSGLDFCAGNDISEFIEMKTMDQSNVNILELPVFKFLKSLIFFNKPIILELKGLCVGIGATMILHCDYIIADASTKLVFPFLKMGLVAEAAFTRLMPEKIGYLSAMELLTRDGYLSAYEALDLRLINKMIDGDGKVAQQVVHNFLSLPSNAFAKNKLLMRNPDQTWEKAVQEGHIFFDLLNSNEFQQYASNFLSK